MISLFNKLIKKYRDWRFCRRFLKEFREWCQFCYKCGFTTEEIEDGFITAINNKCKKEFLDSTEYKRFLRNLPKLISSYHPTKATNFEALP